MVLRKSRFEVRPNAPVVLGEEEDGDLTRCSPEDRVKMDGVGSVLKAYRTAMKELLAGKYAILQPVTPLYMTDACCVMAFLFPDGILIRYDFKSAPNQKGFVGIPEEGTLASMAPQLSGAFVHCPLDPNGYDPADRVVTLTLTAVPPGAAPRDFASHRLYVVAPRLAAPASAHRPVPLVSIRNEFDFQMHGELVSDEASQAVRAFVLRSRLKLPLGWEAIEIYPPYDPEIWNPNLAPLWAESDLLANVVRGNLIDAQFHAIDPNAQARKRVAQLLNGFEKLLEGPEEPMHQYINDNPQLLMPTHVSVRSKLPLGSRVTDFVFREASGDYLLVELERPSRTLFRKDGQQHEDLTHALDQVTDWRRYLEDNLPTVQKELGLDGISANARSLVVIGRSRTLSDELRRKLVAMENERPRLKIMTYDDLLANAKATFENILGPMWDPGPNAEVYFLPPR